MNSNIARKLLEKGADPNAKFERFPPWQNAIYQLHQHGFENERRKDETGRQYSPSGYYFEVLETLEVLLQFGADPRATCEVRTELPPLVDRGTVYVKARYRHRSAEYVLRRALHEYCACHLDHSSLNLKLGLCPCSLAVSLRAKISKLIASLEGTEDTKTPLTAFGDVVEHTDDRLCGPCLRAGYLQPPCSCSGLNLPPKMIYQDLRQ